ncbi:type II secretion system F family protein [Phenylobacterium sp.]|jgi:tight adherence protein C|uniref:type II secretion system F family protein n=1 Tax=Phenylobacterium sp. TaxID=1871053 RepID=UPI002F924F46
MAELVIFLATVLAVLALGAGVAALVMGDRAFDSRLTALSAGRPGAAAVQGPFSAILPTLLDSLIRWGRTAGRGSLETEARASLRMKLVQAGFYADRAAEAFFGIRAAAALLLGVLGLVAGLALNLWGVFGAVAGAMLGANIGLFVPNLVLSSKIKARTEAMYLGLPDAIDLMVVSLEAGATLSAALQRVEAEFRDLHAVVTEQFGIVLAEMQAGASRAEALTRLAARSPGDEVKQLTTMIIQSEAVGASLGDTLRVFAEEMRKTRYLDAERKAAELPVKLAFPLVLFIFPCLTSVIFIPVAIRFIRGLMG